MPVCIYVLWNCGHHVCYFMRHWVTVLLLEWKQAQLHTSWYFDDILCKYMQMISPRKQRLICYCYVTRRINMQFHHQLPCHAMIMGHPSPAPGITTRLKYELLQLSMVEVLDTYQENDHGKLANLKATPLLACSCRQSYGVCHGYWVWHTPNE